MDGSSATYVAATDPAVDPPARLRMLGTLSLRDANLQLRKTLLLLGYLSLAGPQPRKRLAVLFWPRATDGLNRLSVTLSRIKAAAPDAIAADRHRVWTELTTDVGQVLEALESGSSEEALARYRGGFLDGVYVKGLSEELEDWIAATRDDLTRRIQSTLLHQAVGLAHDGRFDLAAGKAESLLELGDHSLLEPAQLERLHTILMAGDSPSAHTLRHEATALELRLAASPSEARERLGHDGATRSIPHNLRSPGTSFVGRDRERLELARLLALADRRLITLIGPGGIGKSRLAHQVAADALGEPRFADGTFFVALEETTTETISSRVAAAAGIVLDAGAAPLEALIDAVARRRLLFVLDDIEAASDPGTAVAALLRACPRVTLLVTSRDRLDLDEEWLYPVEGMPSPSDDASLADARAYAAIELFETRAQRSQPSFRVGDDDLPDIVAICRLTGGSPLALELAAAHVGVLSPGEIAAEIALDLDFLHATARHAPDRHRSLRVVFEHSWRNLHADDRACLRRLAVFRGGFTRDAARAVAGATLPILTSLVAQSLVVPVLQGRYERHPLLHQYTWEKLAEDTDELAETRRRHAAWALDLTRAAHAHRNTVTGARWLERVEADHVNVKTALAWTASTGDAVMLMQLLHASVDFWIRRGHLGEALHWFDTLLALADGLGDDLRLEEALLRHAYVCLLVADYRTPHTLLARSLLMSRRLGDEAGETQALSHLGMLGVFEGRYDDAEASYRSALAIARRTGHTEHVARVLNNLGDASSFRGDLPGARRCYEESLALERSLGDHQMTSNVLGSLAMVALDEEHLAEARGLLEESIGLIRDLGITFSLPTGLEQVAAWATATGLPLVAAHLWGAAVALRDEMRSPMAPFARPQHDGWVGRANRQTDAREFAAAWSEGRRLAMAASIELALTVLAPAPGVTAR